MAKIAKCLNWKRASVCASARFESRFRHYALHENDFYTWATETARSIRADSLDRAIDWESLAEEVEDLARSERRALKSQLVRLIHHLLKWKHQSSRRSESWRASIENARDEIRDLLEENPGLHPELPALIEKAYRMARREAIADTAVPESEFPRSCPWSHDRMMADSFWPGNSAH